MKPTLLVIACCTLFVQQACAQWKKIADCWDTVNHSNHAAKIECVYFPDLSDSPKIGFAAGDLLWKTVDGGKNWEESRLNDGGFTDISFRDSQLGWVSLYGYPHCYRTIDGGATWKPIPPPISGDPFGYAIYYSSFSNRLFLGLLDSSMFVSTDWGDTWQRTGINCAVAFAFSSPSNGIVVTNPIVYYPNSGPPTIIDSLSHVYVTSDGGVTWRMGHQPFISIANAFAYQPLAIPNTSTYFECEPINWGGQIWRSDDSGMNWRVIAVLKDSSIMQPIIRGTLERLYVQSADSGMYTSTDQGVTWTHTGGPSWNANGLSRFYSDKGVTIAAAYDDFQSGPNREGLWRKIDRLESVESERLSASASVIFPNPTHDRITIVLEAPAAYEVRDALGRVVRGPESVARGPGSVEIDVSALPPGVYYISIGSQRSKFVKE